MENDKLKMRNRLRIFGAETGKPVPCPYCEGNYRDASGPGTDCGFCHEGTHTIGT